MERGPGPSPHALAYGPQDDIEAVTRAVLTASRLLVAVSARSLATVEESITLPQFRMLVVLSTRGPSKLVSLADHLGVQPSTAMRMVDRLIASGLMARRTNPANRRETVLRLTEEGSRVVQDVTSRRRKEIMAVLRRLDPAQRTALVEALDVFNSAGQEPAFGGGDQGSHPLGWSDWADGGTQ
ncbi:MarR family transcriptional regulator [Streptomyces sp. NPDC006283]|uniref:MarR family winged helix-turn-helix transcriptional regulator n=1 Tax=Streptomyces sp. NPDC006283 TaxID=3156741 RepID=UPI0033B9CC3B